jgi:hypothetical protein
MEILMRRAEYSLAPILVLTSVGWFTTSGANAPPPIADPSGPQGALPAASRNLQAQHAKT